MMKRVASLLSVLIILTFVFPGSVSISASEESITWRQVDPAEVVIGKSYLAVSEHGALANEQATINTPGDVTGDTQIGLAVKPVTYDDDGLITSGVTDDMIWQFGQGANTAAASGGLGEGPGYYLLNAAPGPGGGTLPLRRESSFNAQHAPINTTGAAINGNQQSLLMHVLDEEEGTVGLYYWAGNNQWNFALHSTEEGFTAKSRTASSTSAAQLLEQMQESPALKLYEPNVDVGEQCYVIATAGENGSISPSSLTGHVWVNKGEDAAFTFIPAFGFEVDKVTVNDEEVTVTDNTYTIEDVNEDGIRIHVTFRPASNTADLPFIVYNDIFGVGNVTTAVIIDLGEGNAVNLADLSDIMFSVAARNTRLDGETIIFDGTRKISRVYVNDEPEPLGYILPEPGSDDLVTDTPESGRYIIVELEFWDANGYLSGAMVSGNLQNSFSAILNYRINVDREIKLTDGSSITPKFIQDDVVNHALDKFVPDQTNPGGSGNMNILISIDESWEELGPLPVFIYNHGGGRGGSNDDPYAPVQTANGAAVLSKLQLKYPGKYNAHIIATQNYSDGQSNNDAFMAYIRNLADQGMVDLNRIYMSGFSAGSMYTAGFFNRNPEFLAAIVPLAGGNLPNQDQLIQNPEYTNTAIWAFTHKSDFMGTTWTNYFSTGAGASGLYQEANVSVMDTNQAFNFPFFGYDWTPHETEAQAYTNLIGQGKTLFTYGPGHEEFEGKYLFDWIFAQVRASEGEVKIKLDGDSLIDNEEKAEYLLSAANMDKVATVTAWIEVDGDYFYCESIEGLNGFDILGDVYWQSDGSKYTARVTLVNLTGGVSSAPYSDILKMTLVPQGALGTTDVKLNRIDISGYDADNSAVYFAPMIINDIITTEITQHYSVYDINRDLVVDQLDLTAAQLYYAAREGDDNWAEAKIADVNEDGRVDIEDLIQILNNIEW